MLKFQAKDELGRPVKFGMNALSPSQDQHIIVVRQLDDYSGPSVTNAAEVIWKSLERFTSPGARCIEYYPQRDAMDEVFLQKDSDWVVTSVTWKPISPEDHSAILSLIEEDDKAHLEI